MRRVPLHRYSITSLAALLLPLVLVALLLEPPGAYGITKKETDPELRITQVSLEGASLEIALEIKNRTGKYIWVYVGHSLDEAQPYETRISEKGRMLSLLFRGVGAMGNTPVEDAVLPRYKELAPGKAIMFRLVLDPVVWDFSPAEGRGEGNMKSSDIMALQVEVGYYGMMLDHEEKCCLPSERPDELYVIPGWASSHPESIMSEKVRKKQRWK